MHLDFGWISEGWDLSYDRPNGDFKGDWVLYFLFILRTHPTLRDGKDYICCCEMVSVLKLTPFGPGVDHCSYSYWELKDEDFFYCLYQVLTCVVIYLIWVLHWR